MGTPELELQLALMVRRLSRQTGLLQSSGALSLTGQAYQAMRRICDEGPLRASALAHLLEIDLSVASRLVRSLEDAGLVRRQRDPLDTRAALVTATEVGRSAFLTTQQQRVEMLGQVLSDWSEDDRSAFATLLGTFNERVEVAIRRRGERGTRPHVAQLSAMPRSAEARGRTGPMSDEQWTG